MLWILQTLQSASVTDLSDNSIESLMNRKIGYIEVEKFSDIEQMRSMVLAGQ